VDGGSACDQLGEANGNDFCSAIGACVGDAGNCEQAICKACDVADGILLGGAEPVGFLGGACPAFDASLDSGYSCVNLGCILDAGPAVLSPSCAAAIASLTGPYLQLCGGAWVDTQTDNANCGGCGLACTAPPPSTTQGCSGGECIVTLASIPSANTGLSAIAVAASGIYWTNDDVEPNSYSGTVMSAPLGGGNATTLTVGQDHPVAIAVDATSAYWVTSGELSGTEPAISGTGTVMKAWLDGGGVTMLASSQELPTGIAIDSTSVYWGGNTADAGGLLKVPLSGGIISLVAPGVYPNVLTIDSATLFWLEGPHSSAPSTVLVRKVQVDGGGLAMLATDSNQAWPYTIAVSSTRVYWTDSRPADTGCDCSNSGAVMSVELDGGGETVFVAGQGGPRSVAVDSTHVYWESLGMLMRAGLDGSGVTTLAATAEVSSNITVDATSVYWISGTSSASTIMKITPK
jgi:hypothetical protein